MRSMEARIIFITLTLLAAAVFFDLKTTKVPNPLIIAGYITGALLRIRAPEDALQCLADILWPIIILYPLFLMRGLGAGDIKLFSVLSILYPFSILIQIMILSLYVGAGLIISRKIYERLSERSYKNFIHYTLCILIAYCILLLREGLS